MKIDFKSIWITAIIALITSGIDRMPSSESWTVSIILWCFAGILTIALLIYLFYWPRYKKKRNQTEIKPNGIISPRPLLPRWSVWVITIALLLVIVFDIYGIINKTHPQQITTLNATPSISTPTITATPTFTPTSSPVLTSIMTPTPTLSLTPTVLKELTQEPQLSSFTPLDIFTEIDKIQSSYLQNQARQNYQGRPVVWDVKLDSITNWFDVQQIYTNPANQTSSFPTVVIYANIDEYPSLKTMNIGKVFRVKGTIESINQLNIILDNCYIFVP